MNQVKNVDPCIITCEFGPDRRLIVVDDLLLGLLQQLVAMELATTWEVRINEPIEHEFTATKLMQRLVKKVLVTD
jgi:hypothetical protein